MSATSAQSPRPTYLFDGRRGHNMNKLLMSLRKEVQRKSFRSDEAAYCAQFALNDEETDAILRRDWQAMLDLGGSIFYIYKLAMMDGLSMQYLGGVFTGMTEAEFKAAMLAGGRTDV